jgi:hypothetical protein
VPLKAASGTAPGVALKITLGHPADVPGMKRTGGWRASLTDKARRTRLAVSAAVVALALQLLLLVGVFDDTPTWVQIVVFMVYALLVAIVLTMAVLNVKDQRASRER